MKLWEMTSPQVTALDKRQVVVAPYGALEQHSQHLPLFTDSILVEAVAERIERALPAETLLLPVQWLGASAHHMAFGGTLTADLDTHIRLVREPLECLYRHGFRKFFVLNGHGGNIDTFHIALRELKLAHPDATWAGASHWNLAPDSVADICEGPQKSIGHADEIETSMVLALRPDLVDASKTRDDLICAPESMQGIFIAELFDEITHRGQEGYASYGSGSKGERMLAVTSAAGVRVVQTLYDGLSYDDRTG